jgi:hypothetical protein
MEFLEAKANPVIDYALASVELNRPGMSGDSDVPWVAWSRFA